MQVPELEALYCKHTLIKSICQNEKGKQLCIMGFTLRLLN